MINPKFESIVKSKLEDRTLVPSTMAWEKLSLQLANEKATKSRSYRFWLLYAVVFLLLLGSGLYFNPVLTEAENSISPQLEDVSKKNIPPSIEPRKKASLEIKIPSRMVQQKLNSIQKLPLKLLETELVVSQITRSSIPSIDTEANSEIEIITDSLLTLESDALIELVLKQLKNDQSNKSRQEALALELLVSTEKELLSETQFKHKVIHLIKNSYSRIKVAINESDKTKNPK
ncbi:MAG: hypothetical protein VW080_10660 [Flavobacteriaceae bacterium]